MKFKTGHEKLPKLKYKVIKEKKSVEKDTKQSLQEPQDYIKWTTVYVMGFSQEERVGGAGQLLEEKIWRNFQIWFKRSNLKSKKSSAITHKKPYK